MRNIDDAFTVYTYGMAKNDDDNKESLEQRHRLDAERLAKEKTILEETTEEEERERIAAGRNAAAAAVAMARQQAALAAKNQKQKPSLEAKKRLEEKQAQEKAWQPSVIFSIEAMRPSPKTPKSTPRPLPTYIQKFLDGLTDIKTRKSVHYDPSSGRLMFSGPKGLDALAKFLTLYPDSKFSLLTTNANLKRDLQALHGQLLTSGTVNLLYKMAAIDVDGKVITNPNEIQREIQNAITPESSQPELSENKRHKAVEWPPKLTPPHPGEKE